MLVALVLTVSLLGAPPQATDTAAAVRPLSQQAAPQSLPSRAATQPVREELKGYAEWRAASDLIVDGQRVVATEATKYSGEVRALAAIPVGYEVKVKGVRQPDGSVAASEISAKPNGLALFESEVLEASAAIEREWLQAGAVTRAEEVDGKPVTREIGRIVRTGPRVERLRRIVERVAPPYVESRRIRTYVVTSEHWNAMAMANGAIWVFEGLLDDMSDDEVAFIVGHELAHVTHEHSRQANLKAMWATAIVVAGVMAAEHIDSKTAKLVVEIAAVIGPLAWVNRYNRAQEDQADRVGLRYAFEGGYDPIAGANVWARFRAKYGDSNRILNFFIGDHGTAKQRSERLQAQVALNYGPGRARQPAPTPAVMAAPGDVRTLRTVRGSAGRAPSTAVLPGMTPDAVRAAIGGPLQEASAGAELRWVYDDCTVVFTNGRVSQVIVES